MNANTYMYSERNRVSVFGEELVKFCNEYSLILSDVSKLGRSENIYTHYSVSWLDHCISTVNAHRLINYVHISDTVMVSDHLPLSVHLECEVNVINNDNHDTKANPKTNVNWTWLTELDKNIYRINSDNLLQNVYIPADMLYVRVAGVNHKRIE